MARTSISRRGLIGVAVMSVAAVAGTAAALAASSSGGGGSLRIFDVSHSVGPAGRVLLTGAIGDHGRSEVVTRSGKVSESGHYVELTLSQGTVLLKATGLDRTVGKSFGHGMPNRATCSFSAAGSGTLPIVSGTGRYAGVTGSLHVLVAVGYVFRREHGKCTARMGPVAVQSLVYGTGRASF